jgi:hypothetical protein
VGRKRDIMRENGGETKRESARELHAPCLWGCTRAEVAWSDMKTERERERERERECERDIQRQPETPSLETRNPNLHTPNRKL